jgi:hypothetical protein
VVGRKAQTNFREFKSSSQFKESSNASHQPNNQNLNMKFSTSVYFMISSIAMFANTFGMANDLAPEMSYNERRELELKGMEQYKQDMDLVDASKGDRELSPGISCYTRWCLGKVRGTCYMVYPMCYPL